MFDGAFAQAESSRELPLMHSWRRPHLRENRLSDGAPEKVLVTE